MHFNLSNWYSQLILLIATYFGAGIIRVILNKIGVKHFKKFDLLAIAFFLVTYYQGASLFKFAFLPYLTLGMSIVGLILAFLQGFKKQIKYGRFFRIYWRISGLLLALTYFLLLIYHLIKFLHLI